MKIVICLMGYQGSGIYKIEQYLIEAYGVKRFRGYTTRRRKFLEDTSEYNFVEVFEMIELEKNSDLIGLRKYNNNLYVKRVSEIPKGISVCAIDYNGYLELSKKVKTIPIFLDRKSKYRYKYVKSIMPVNPTDFLERDYYDDLQFSRMKDDSNVLKLRYEGNVTTKLKIDNIMFPLLKYIKQQDKTIKLEE